jgi:hypothetical protein
MAIDDRVKSSFFVISSMSTASNMKLLIGSKTSPVLFIDFVDIPSNDVSL